ncbi:MAG: hypothetical protein IT452_14475 [Planctomycetia bacterium]|nr:hypothetical protein [Planctomycetia bacterium]
MSRVKLPREKKRLQLERDRRNVYGENSKASRKNIPLAKARTHREERMKAREALAGTAGVPEEDRLIQLQKVAETRTKQARRHGFRKDPDRPLGKVLRARGKR